MMMFPEPGSYPGIPGNFASCQVSLNEDGTPNVQPLAQHHSFEPAPADAPTADVTATASPAVEPEDTDLGAVAEAEAEN